MNNRHVSADDVYPFLPQPLQPSALNDIIVKSIKEIFSVIRGAPDLNTGTPLDAPRATLRVLVVSPNNYQLLLSYYYTEGQVWDYEIAISTLGLSGIQSIEAVTNDRSRITAIVDIDHLEQILVTPPALHYILEPSRTVWAIEEVNKITLSNIERCNSVETPNNLIVVETYDSGNSSMSIGNGYNTALSYAGNTLSIDADINLGQGTAPDFGNNVGGCEAVDPNQIDGIFSINGLVPVDGDISLEVSAGLAMEQTAGQLKIARRLS